MKKKSKEEVMKLVEEEDVEFIRLQFTDIFGNLKNVHAFFQFVIACLNLLAQAGKVAVILEKCAVFDQALLLQIVGHAGETVAAFHREGILLRVCGIDGTDKMLVHRRIHA